MICLTWEDLPYSDDEKNICGYRNIRNTDKSCYNCGGYALGTFSWYCPNEESDDPWGSFMGWSQSTMKKLTQKCVSFMLKDFPDMRVISSIEELKQNEYAIAFRLASYGDFHFVKRAKNGHWFHKRGGCYMIETMKETEVFSSRWGHLYDGPLVLFAKEA